MIRVQVCMAAPTEPGQARRVLRRDLELKPPASVHDAIAALGDPALVDALAQERLRVAVYGRLYRSGQLLVDGDRLELLGPVQVDPKVARARRAQVQRARKGDRRWGV